MWFSISFTIHTVFVAYWQYIIQSYYTKCLNYKLLGTKIEDKCIFKRVSLNDCEILTVYRVNT